MKKSLVLMAMAGVTLASCVNDVAEVAQKEEKVAIKFESPLLYDNASVSRASVFGEIGPVGSTNRSYPKEESFTIYAIQYVGEYKGWTVENVTTPADFNGDALMYDQNMNGWAPKKDDGGYYYWPAGKNMAFAAYSPADLTVEEESLTDINANVVPSYGVTGLNIENFQVMPDPAKQYDLMFSQRIVDINSSNLQHGADNYSGIPLVFQHALSSIRFSLQNKTKAEVVIKKIDLRGACDMGTFNEGINTDNGQYERGGDTPNVTPGWTGQTKSSDDLVYHVFEGAVTAPYEAQYLSSLLELDKNRGTFHQLLLMPQTITGSQINVSIVYTIDGEENSKVVKLEDALKLATQGKDDVTNEILSAWEMGYRYTYRLQYSEESASKDRIYFAPSSDAWKEGGAYCIEL